MMESQGCWRSEVKDSQSVHNVGVSELFVDVLYDDLDETYPISLESRCVAIHVFLFKTDCEKHCLYESEAKRKMNYARTTTFEKH